MTTKQAHDILVACETREQLRAALHDHFGLSVDESRTCTRKWFPVTAAKDANGAITRAGVARTFRDAQQKRVWRHEFVKQIMPWLKDEAEREAPVQMMMGRLREVEGKYMRGPNYLDPSGGKDPTVIARIQAEKVTGILDELDACKDRDALEAKLITLGWKDAQISEYMEYA